MASKTTSSVVDVLDRVIGIPQKETNDDGERAEFIASDKFSGSKPGYVFQTSKEFGTGYHLDVNSSDQKIAAPSLAGGREKKRARINNGEDFHDNGESGKRSIRWGSDTTRAIPARQKRSGDELLAEAEAQASEQPSQRLLELTPRGVQSAAQSLDRTLQRNQLLRAQHQDDPSKFMMNELALNDEIVSFQAAAVNVSSYESLVKFGVVRSFLMLLNHENSDVAISVINALVELLDPTLLQEDRKQNEEDEATEIDPIERAQNIGLFASAFVDGGGLELMTSNLGRFDETVEEEAKGIEDVLALVESLLDLDRAGVLQNGGGKLDNENDQDGKTPSVVSSICKQTSFVAWLFNRIEKRDNADATATAPTSPAVLNLHASEVLSAILQHEDYSTQRCGTKLSSLPKYSSVFDDLDEKPAAKQKAGDNGNGSDDKEDKVDGMEVLLQSIAAFRKVDPQTEVECEFLENVFDALSASLLRKDNVVDFVEYQGIELMLRCLREKVHAGGGALKVLNFALSGPARNASEEDSSNGSDDVYKKACETFVHAGGLKILFPLFMARKNAIPCPALCSEAGSNLAKKAMSNNAHQDEKNKASLSKRAKRAAHARKKWLAEVEQNVIYIMYALTRYIDEKSQFDAHARVLVKFVEEDCVSVFPV